MSYVDAEYLQDCWTRTWAGLNGRPADGVFERLFSRYAEAHRAYHTLQHLTECLKLRQQLGAACASSAEVDLALFFHDAIYEPMRSDNEVQSAVWLETVAASAGLDASTRERLRRLVMVTRHDGLPDTDAEAVLVDTDLGILGADEARFDEYDRQVRLEYRRVPMVLYGRKRREVLRTFLGRERIYVTPAYQSALEAQARVNLTRAVERLH